MKLRHLHIEDYKMFKDFDISFVDENDEPLPIVVLAGVNGSGKTSLLEFINDFFDKYYLHIYQNKLEFIIDNETKSSYELNSIENRLQISEQGKKYLNDFFYFSSGIDDIKKIEKEFVKYWYDQVKFHNKRNDEITEDLQEFISKILDGLTLDFTYSYIDSDDNIFFQNDNKKFKISELSTGEQTLLSKVLYLFLKDYKDKVILIDEPELSLHPSWQNQILKIYENFALKNNCQIIIATHSPHIIGSAKAEYIRLLKKVDDKVVTIKNIDRSYGLEFDQILTDIMGVENLRTPDVAKDIKKLWDLLEDEDYESEEYLTLYDNLEELLGSLDKDMVLARLEIARIKSRNAKSK